MSLIRFLAKQKQAKENVVTSTEVRNADVENILVPSKDGENESG